MCHGRCPLTSHLTQRRQYGNKPLVFWKRTEDLLEEDMMLPPPLNLPFSLSKQTLCTFSSRLGVYKTFARTVWGGEEVKDCFENKLKEGDERLLFAKHFIIHSYTYAVSSRSWSRVSSPLEVIILRPYGFLLPSSHIMPHSLGQWFERWLYCETHKIKNFELNTWLECEKKRDVWFIKYSQ